MLGVLFIVGVLACAGVIAAQVFPTVVEYQAILKAASNAKFRDPSDALRPEVLAAISVEQDEDDPEEQDAETRRDEEGRGPADAVQGRRQREPSVSPENLWPYRSDCLQ